MMCFSKRLFSIGFVLILSGCHFSSLNVEFNRGKKAYEAKQYQKAIKHFDRVIVREPESPLALESARQASRIAFFDIKEFKSALKFYNHLILHSPTSIERIESQKRVASIYFDHLNDYQNAIVEYNRLLSLKNSNDDIIDYKLRLGKAYFYLNNFYQAQTEIESALKIADDSPARFDLLLLLGNIFYNTKKIPEAIKAYQELMNKYPERAKNDNVAMNIVVCYEELEQFDNAIEELVVIREDYPNPEFIDLKIQRLRDRKANLPGSRGLRK